MKYLNLITVCRITVYTISEHVLVHVFQWTETSALVYLSVFDVSKFWHEIFSFIEQISNLQNENSSLEEYRTKVQKMENEKSEFLEKISRLENSLKEAKTNASNIASNEAGKWVGSITQENRVTCGLYRWILKPKWNYCFFGIASRLIEIPPADIISTTTKKFLMVQCLHDNLYHFQNGVPSKKKK